MQRRATKSLVILYTGGTIGSVPIHSSQPNSPLVPAQDALQVLLQLPSFDVVSNTVCLRGIKFPVKLLTLNQVIDSSNIQVEHWIEMADLLGSNLENAYGAVVMHGTDTLAYTASALSFLFTHLNQPIVITGSQLPMGKQRSDAVQNLQTALEIAAAKYFKDPVIAEVCVYFDHSLLRGNRCTKVSANDFHAFESPNYPPLAVARRKIVYFPSRFRQASRNRPALQWRNKISTSVASLEIFPGMNHQLFSKICHTPELKGLVIRSYGAGNAPTTQGFLKSLRSASLCGKVFVDVTQCWSGQVELGVYESSLGLLFCRVVSGFDCTPEAALTKLMIILGYDLPLDQVRHTMAQSIRGEQSQMHLLVDLRYCEKSNRLLLIKPEIWKGLRTVQLGLRLYDVDTFPNEIEIEVGIKSKTKRLKLNSFSSEGIPGCFLILDDLLSDFKNIEWINLLNLEVDSKTSMELFLAVEKVY